MRASWSWTATSPPWATGAAITKLLAFPLATPETIQVTEQAALKQQAIGEFAGRFALTIDGQAVEFDTLARNIADQAAAQLASAQENATRDLTAGIERLEDLARRNDHIAPAEIQSLKDLQSDLSTALSQSRLRLDALRLIWKSPV